MTKKRRFVAIIMAVAIIGAMLCGMAFAAEEENVLLAAPASESVFSVDIDGEAVDYDLSDEDSAHAYVGDYANNLTNDPSFESHVDQAIKKVRESISSYATILSLLPPIIAIVLALITKEVYSSLFIGIVIGGVFYAIDAAAGFGGFLTHVFSGGLVGSLSDSYNVGILIFLVILGTMVALMNKAGGSAAFGNWAKKHIKTKVGAQCATILLGILIFVDDYFNCLTVGSVTGFITEPTVRQLK